MTTPPWKTALVTGASSGLGRGLAAWLTARGVKVYAAARRMEQLEQLQKELGELLVPLQLDVSDGNATYAAVKELDGTSGGLDLVIANAGVGTETKPRRISWEATQQMIDVNCRGAAATLTGALPGMIERGSGQLVGISSLASFIALPFNSTYCASKAFLTMFLDGLRLDVEQFGLTVTGIHPGFVKTELTAKNKPGSMPFILESEDAVERMGKAMLKKKKTLTFPWQLSSLISTASALPRPIRTAALRKLR